MSASSGVHGIIGRVLGVAMLTGGVASAATIIVPDDNPSLPAAVQASGPGDTIQVRPGNYPEAITIRAGHDGLTIEGLGGRPVFTAANRKDGFRIKGSNGVTIRGFDFLHRKTPVLIDGSGGCVVDDIQASDCREGVRIKGGGFNGVLSSSFSGTTRGRAIRADHSDFVTLGGNTIVGAARSDGILVGSCDDALVVSNNVSAHRRGLVIKNSANATVDDNVTDGNGREGMAISHADSLSISNNTSDNNGSYGFRVDHSPPIATIADLTGAGNTATGNGTADFRVD